MEKKIRFKIEKSIQNENWWVLTDLQYKVMMRFEHQNYRNTLEVAVMEDSVLSTGIIPDLEEAKKKVLRDMECYLMTRHFNKANKPAAFEFRYNDELGKWTIVREKYPAITVILEDDCRVMDVNMNLKKILFTIHNRRMSDNFIGGGALANIQDYKDYINREDLISSYIVKNEFE